MLPPLPSWDGLHPLIVHFPIALAFVAPLFALLALLDARRRPAFGLAALLLLAIAAGGAFVAVATGEAAGELAERSPAINATLEQHEHRAQFARNALAATAALYGVAFGAAALWGGRSRRARLLSALPHGAAVVASAACALLVAQAAHQGGRLVHEHGVRALMPAAPAVATASATGTATPTGSAPEAAEEHRDTERD